MKYFLILLFLACSICSCYNDNAEVLYGNSGTCNTANMTYSANIGEILNRYGCVGCHSGSAPSGGVNLQTYEAVKARAADGRLWGAINHLPGFKPMPQGGNKMDQCDINKIKAWMDATTPQ